MSTGLKSFIFVAKSNHKELSITKLENDYSIGEEEVQFSVLMKMARENNFQARSLEGTWADIKKLNKAFPVIAQLVNGRYVVLMKYQEKNSEESVFLWDPSKPKSGIQEIAKEQFLNVWNGKLLLLKLRLSIMDEKQPFSSRWVLREIIKEKMLIGQMIFVALIMEFFGFLPIIYIMTVLDKVINYESYSTLIVIAIGVFIAQVFNGVFGYIKKYMAVFFSSKIEAKLSVHAFNKALDLPISYFNKRSGTQVTRQIQAASTVYNFLTRDLFGTLLDTIGLVIFIPILIMYSPLLFSIVFIFSALISINNILSTRKQKERFKSGQSAEEKKQSILSSSIYGITTIKSLAIETRQKELWESSVTSQVLSKIEQSKGSIRSGQISSTLQQLMSVFVIFIGVLLVFNGKLSAGILIGVNMMANKIAGPLTRLATFATSIEQFVLAVKSLSDILNTHGESRKRGVTPRISGAVEFKNVHFNYHKDIPLLRDLSFEIKAREKIGIIGPSGCGKSTLGKLFEGILFPRAGSIFIDGVDITTFDVNYLRSCVAYISSENHFFNESIRDNILKPMPLASIERLNWVTKLIHLDDGLNKLPEQLETVLDQDAANISTSMRQRVALARGLITNPSILILDEALSGVSTIEEVKILENLSEIKKGRTVIMITHHLHQVIDSDKIIVLTEEGKVAEVGSHNELIKIEGHYASLWDKTKRLLSTERVAGV